MTSFIAQNPQKTTEVFLQTNERPTFREKEREKNIFLHFQSNIIANDYRKEGEYIRKSPTVFSRRAQNKKH